MCAHSPEEPGDKPRSNSLARTRQGGVAKTLECRVSGGVIFVLWCIERRLESSVSYGSCVDGGSASACFPAGAVDAVACSAAAYAVSVDHPVACMCARSQEAPVESDAELPTIGDCVSFEEACAISWAF